LAYLHRLDRDGSLKTLVIPGRRREEPDFIHIAHTFSTARQVREAKGHEGDIAISTELTAPATTTVFSYNHH
jgi:hypothetical protein